VNVKPKTIRQGDVALFPVAKLPEGCTEVPNDNGRIVLAYGEVTGHAHAIADHISAEAASEIADAAIARARLWQAPNGDRFLEVKAPVSLSHEEHATHVLPPGIYEVPVQVEMTTANTARRVAD
jgi:hypothetical protein